MIALYGVLDECKKKILLALSFIAGVFFIGLYGIGSSDGYLTLSELLSDPQVHIGQNVNSMEIVEYGSLEVALKRTVFELRDENNENLKVHVEYTGNLPSNLAEGKQMSISGTRFLNLRLRQQDCYRMPVQVYGVILMNIEEWEEYRYVESGINTFIAQMEDSSLKKMVEHVCNTGGKRIRPIILLLASEICSGSYHQSLGAALAIEMMHSASLIHDDLLDQGLLRRNLPSAPEKFGPSRALLCGDYLHCKVH